MEINVTVDGGGHVLRTNTLLLCRGVRKRLSFVVCSDLAGEAQDSGWTQTRFFTQERNEWPCAASFRSFLFYKVE